MVGVVFASLAGDPGWHTKNTVHDAEPERDKRHKIIKLVGSVHAQAQKDRDEIDAEHDLEKTHQSSVPRLPHVRKVVVSGQKEIRRDQHLDVHIDWDHTVGASHLIDQETQLHPSLQLVGLVAVQHFRESTVLGEEESQRKYVTNRYPKTELRIVFVLLHEEIGPVAHIKVQQNHTEAGQRKDRCRRIRYVRVIVR